MNIIKKKLKKIKLHTLKSIEKEIIENQKRLNEIEYTLREEYDGNKAYFLKHEAIEIKKDDKILNLKRQYKLDARNGWKHRVIWSISAPIIVTIITLYLLSYFELKTKL